jgi:hypothetical protein
MGLPEPYYDKGGITIYNADCREVLPHLSGIDLVLTDPPFGVLDEEWDDMNAQQFAAFCMSWLGTVRSLDCPLITFAGEKTRKLFNPLLESLYDTVRQIIWNKSGGSVAENGIWYSYESVYLCCGKDTWETVTPKTAVVGELIRKAREEKGLSRGGVDIAIRGKKTGLCYRWEEGACLPTEDQASRLLAVLPLNGEFSAALAKAYADRNETMAKAQAETAERAAKTLDVLTYATPSQRIHPCQKPLGLIRELIESQPKAKVILDLFGGSGTTAEACKRLGRRCIVIEQDEAYCRHTVERLRQEVLPLGA